MENTTLFFQIFSLSGKYTILDFLMIFGAGYMIYLTALLVVTVGLAGKPREKQAFLLTFFSYILSVVLFEIIHLFVNEPRPFVTYSLTPLIPPTLLIHQAADAAFPSAHTISMAVAFFSFAFYRSKWAYLLFIFLLWVGFARIFVGVHYPFDILGGVLTGLIAVLIIWNVKNYLWQKYFAFK